MIKIKPILHNINAFDAKKSYEITFSYTGNQPIKNTCIIRDNNSNTIVYSHTVETLQLLHTIPANLLVNGKLYNVAIYVTDNQNISSNYSDYIHFYCYDTPTFTMNIQENQTVQNSIYPIQITYSQLQNELLQYFQVILYDQSRNQIWSSGVKYDTDNLSISLSGLKDNQSYYVRATGITINGMNLDTGMTLFHVDYITPNIYAIVSLENKDEDASVLIKSNIISIEGKFNDWSTSDPKYIENDFIDLSDAREGVTFDSGFTLDGNFTINLKGYGFNDLTGATNIEYRNTILLLKDINKKSIRINKRKGSFHSEGGVEKTFFELTVPSAFGNYVIESNYIDHPLNTDVLSIWIRKIGSIYDIVVQNLTQQK